MGFGARVAIALSVIFIESDHFLVYKLWSFWFELEIHALMRACGK